MDDMRDLLQDFMRRMEGRIDDIARQTDTLSERLDRRLSSCEQIMGASTFVENVCRNSSPLGGTGGPIDSQDTRHVGFAGEVAGRENSRHVATSEAYLSCDDRRNSRPRCSTAALSSTHAIPYMDTNPFLEAVDGYITPGLRSSGTVNRHLSIDGSETFDPLQRECQHTLRDRAERSSDPSIALQSFGPMNPFCSSLPLSPRPTTNPFLCTHDVPGTATNPFSTCVASDATVNRRTKPPPYDGKASWYDYRRQFEIISKLNGWSDADRANMLAASLRSDALAVLSALPPTDNLEYTSLCRALERRFGGVQGTHITTFRVRVQKQKESIAEFAFDIQRLSALAFPDCPPDAVQKLVVSQFLEGLRETNTKVMVQLSRPNTLDEALRTALEIEASLSTSRPNTTRNFFMVENERNDRRSNGRRRFYRRRNGGSDRTAAITETPAGNETPSAPQGSR